MSAIRSVQPATELNVPDLRAVKAKQQATWASGDFAVIGTTLQIVGELLAESVDIRAGERVLDVAAGNGNATLAAARRFAHVISQGDAHDHTGIVEICGQRSDRHQNPAARDVDLR